MTTQEQVLVTGDIVTMDPARPRAQAFAVHGGRIVAVGTRDEARAALEPVVDQMRRNGLLEGEFDPRSILHRTALKA